MVTLLIVLLLVIWAASMAGPRYYPAYTNRHRRYPLWGGRSNVLLGVLAVIVLLWLFGLLRISNLPSPFANNVRSTHTITVP